MLKPIDPSARYLTNSREVQVKLSVSVPLPTSYKVRVYRTLVNRTDESFIVENEYVGVASKVDSYFYSFTDSLPSNYNSYIDGIDATYFGRIVNKFGDEVFLSNTHSFTIDVIADTNISLREIWLYNPEDGAPVPFYSRNSQSFEINSGTFFYMEFVLVSTVRTKQGYLVSWEPCYEPITDWSITLDSGVNFDNDLSQFNVSNRYILSADPGTSSPSQSTFSRTVFPIGVSGVLSAVFLLELDYSLNLNGELVAPVTATYTFAVNS